MPLSKSVVPFTPRGVPLLLFAGQDGFLVIFGKKMFFTGITYQREKVQPNYIQIQVGCKQPFPREISKGGDTECQTIRRKEDRTTGRDRAGSLMR